MNTCSLLGIGWPDAATFSVPYGLASALALFLTVWLLAFLKRTADEHYRLLKEKEREDEAAAPADEEDEEGSAGAPAPGPNGKALILAGLVLALGPTLVLAQEAKDPAPSITVGAFVETYVGWNFNEPENGVTAFRGFDARHNSFALSNAVIDTRWSAGAISGRLALQTGDTPDIYYGAEATSDVRHILEATVAWKAPVGKGLTLDGGIFLSPIGPEGIPVKDNWNWSRSTLFFGLPFYHAGMRATYAVSERWNVTGAVYNGWNNVTDTNGKKSISLQGFYTKPDKITASILYFGGVERPRGAPEGQPWRNLFDSHITVSVSPTLSIQAHADGGFEDTTFGRASWRAAALAARVKANEWLHLAGRADILDETIPSSSAGTASALFFPATRVRSLTATLDARPVDRLSVRLEFRHDAAADPIYFEGALSTRSAKSQSTLTFGLTAWF
ncbi:MAG TPA: outer membrane beta-barrel protein [Vicinamibacteria bacterium]|nr:outer membrane beta-barrel protein [Vicinamibacteria bacterium]